MAGVLFFVAVLQFVLGLIIAEALYPGYSVSDNYISDLGVGHSSMVFNSSVFLRGLLSRIGTCFLRRTLDFEPLTILLLLMAIGAMGVGVFTKDLGIMHGGVSLMAFLLGGLATITSIRTLKTPLRIISVVLGIMALGALGLFIGGLITTGLFTSGEAQNSYLFLGLGPGGMERMIVYPTPMWLAGFGRT